MVKVLPLFILHHLKRVESLLRRLSALIKSTFRNHQRGSWHKPVLENLHFNCFLLQFQLDLKTSRQQCSVIWSPSLKWVIRVY